MLDITRAPSGRKRPELLPYRQGKTCMLNLAIQNTVKEAQVCLWEWITTGKATYPRVTVTLLPLTQPQMPINFLPLAQTRVGTKVLIIVSHE